MQIKDKINYKMKAKPITFRPENTIQEALEVMCEKNIGSIVITDLDETVVGIVTERDMMIRVLAAKIDPEKTMLSEIMSQEVKVANQNDNLVDWIQTMSNERFRHLPIVDENGKLLNMISQGDFVAYTWPDLYEKFRQDLKGSLGRSFQILLIVLTIVTLGLIKFKL